MDEDARRYQDLLHKANEGRMRGIETKLDRVLEATIEIGATVKIVPSLEKRVDDLEEAFTKDRSFRKGVSATVLFLGSLAGAGIAEGFKALVHLFVGK